MHGTLCGTLRRCWWAVAQRWARREKPRVQEPLATLVVNKLRGNLKVIAVKAPGFGERKTSYLEDIAIMTGATLVKDELGTTLENATEEVFGLASKVTVGKEACTIVAGDAHEAEIGARVAQIKNMIEQTEQDYEREKLNERVARLSGGVAVIQARTPPADGSSSDHFRRGADAARARPAGGRADGDGAEGEEAARGGRAQRDQGRGGGGHLHRRRLHAPAPRGQGGRHQGRGAAPAASLRARLVPLAAASNRHLRIFFSPPLFFQHFKIANTSR